MIVTASYFQGELELPNIKRSGGSGVSQAVQTSGELEQRWFIAKYEREFLDKLLGRKLAKNFLNGLKKSPIADIWIDLKDCIYIEHDGFFYSPAANYVYYWIQRTARTQTTTKSEHIPKQDYSAIASNSHKLVQAWNDMLPMIGIVYDFLRDNRDDYAEYMDDSGCDFHPINAFNI